MKYFLWLLLLVGIAAILVSCGPDPVIGGKSPELSEEVGQSHVSPSPAKGPAADNSRCHVCHINYDEEELAVTHAQAGIGCEECHGKSYAHADDEANVTAPDVIYPKEKINAFCLSCHPADKLPEDHKAILAGTAADAEYCTDCHGDHRLGYRTQHWDKATGKPIKK
jgi:hypothetical protein